MIYPDNITKKVYKKLAIEVTMKGLSFCCFDTLNNTVKSIKTLNFDGFDPTTKTEDLFADAFSKNPELKEPEVIYFPSINTIGIQGHPEWEDHKNPFLNWANNQIILHCFDKKV